MLLLDVFGNPGEWLEDRYTSLDERWVQPGTGEVLSYRDASQAGLTEEPVGGWTPSSLLKAWRNNVGPATAKDPDWAWEVPGSNVSRYNDEAAATRRTAYWFNMERKWSMCQCAPLLQLLDFCAWCGSATVARAGPGCVQH